MKLSAWEVLKNKVNRDRGDKNENLLCLFFMDK